MISSLIVAHGKDFSIGAQNKLLWHLSDDLKNFKKITLNKPIIMGRKTFESIGRPLPKRENIILTSQENFHKDDCTVFHDFESVDKWAIDQNKEEIIYIGGGEIYKEALKIVDRLYITVVDASFSHADTFFPKYNFDEYKELEHLEFKKDDKNQFDFDFYVLEKKK